MSVSALATKIIPADESNFTAGRSKFSHIMEITLHHMAGNLSVVRCGELWQNPARNGSSHYGVNGGDIACYVTEGDVAWTNGNWDSNCRAVTIEVANSGGAPDWPVSDESIESVIALVADIARRNKLGELVVGKNLTMHKQYAATACPGPYLESKFTEIASRSNEINAQDEQQETSMDMQALKSVMATLQETITQMITIVESLDEAQKKGNIW